MIFEAAPLLLNPEFDAIVIPFVTIVLCLILAGLLWSIKWWLEPLLTSFLGEGGNIFIRVINWTLNKITAPVRWGVKEISHYLSVALAGVESIVGKFFHSVGALILSYVTDIADTFHSFADALWELTWITIPKAIAHELTPVANLTRRAWGKLSQLESLAKTFGYAGLATLIKAWHVTVSDAEKAITYVERHGYKSLAGALSVFHVAAQEWGDLKKWVRSIGYFSPITLLNYLHHAIAVTIPNEIGHIYTDIAGLKDLLRKIEAKVSDTAIAAAVALAITKLGLDWIKCKNTKGVGGKLCGLDESLFGNLLEGLIAIDLVLNLDEIVSLAEKTADGLIGTIEEIVG